MFTNTTCAGPIGAWRRPVAAGLLLAILAGCGGGGGGSPTATTPVDPGPGPGVTDPGPSVPMVAGSVTVPNDAAIDPTLAFRAVPAPAAPGFQVTVTAPDSPVIVWNRHNGPRADLAPDDLDAMARRAGNLWTRRLTDGGVYPLKFPVELYIGRPSAMHCSQGGIACAGAPGGSLSTPNARIELTDGYLERVGTHNGATTRTTLKTLVHEVGHALNYLDPQTNHGHAACTTNTAQVMCPVVTTSRPTAPAEADFAGLRYWTVSPASSATDHQDFGLWASVPGASGLDGFGITVRRTLSVDESVSHFRPAADALTDTITAAAEVRGTAGAGPAAGFGTATWAGIFLGADSERFEPVTGDAVLTADLANLAAINLALSALTRTDGTGATHPLAAIGYELERHGNAWIDADSRADARFYAADGDPAGAAAGVVSDAGRSLIGAWGAERK